MAQLRGKAKEEFLKRMERGRKKAAKSNPKRKAAAKKKKAAPKRKAAKKKATKKNASGRKTKKLFKKAFGRGIARETVKARRSTAKSKARNGNKPKTKKKNSRRRNSSIDEAAKLYTDFHGRAPGHIDEYDVSMRFPENFAELGRLKELRVHLDSTNPDFGIDGFGDCKVVATADAANIYFIGGNQKLDLESLDIASDKDEIDLGPCTYIMYHTKKGFHDFEPIDYYHRFGEENGIMPRLIYNRLNHRLSLVSGDYKVRPEGIVN